MELNEFYDTVKDIFVYPGSLQAWNDRNERGLPYDEITLEGSLQYVSGLIIIPQNMMHELASTMMGISLDIKSVQELQSDYTSQEKIEDMMNLMNRIMGDKDYVQALDIRMKAKELGADGLVGVQFYGTSNLTPNYSEFSNISLTTYMGIPVKQATSAFINC